MKRFKKLTSLVLASAMVASCMAGCGGSTSTNEGSTGTEQTASEAGSFKIGGSGPLTGGAAVYGEAVKNGAQIAVDEINAAGGINGYPIKFKFEDDEHDAEKAVNAFNTLLDWDMQMMMGTVTSSPCIAVVDKTFENNIFQLTPSATATESIANENAFRVCFSDPNQGTASAQYIGTHKLASKVGIIYNSSDSYSSGIMQNFVAEAKNQGFEVVSNEAFTDDNASDFTTQLQSAANNGAELIFLPIYCEAASLILTQANQKGISIPFLGCDGLDGILSLEGFDTSLAEGVLLLTPFSASATDEKTQNFVKSYSEKFGLTPNQFAADAYDAMYIMKAAAEKANINPSMSKEEIVKAMEKAMTEITFTGITGTDITWDASGEPSKAPIVVEIKNGAYEILQ